MHNLNPYTIALLLNEGNFSCVKASKTLGFVSHDALTRELQKGYGFTSVADRENIPKTGGTICVDTSPICKPYGPQVEGVSYVYDSTQQKSVLGIEMMVALWEVEGQVYVLQVWFPQDENNNELFREFIQELKDEGFEPEKVLFDCWFSASETLNLIHSFGWTYMTRPRCNRIFNGRSLNSFRFWGAQGRTGTLKGVGHRVQVVKDGNKYGLTNDLTPHQTLTWSRLYQERWIIETFFRGLKHVLHLQQCSSRSLDAQFHHALACIQAYLYLRKSFPSHSLEAAKQEMLDAYRCNHCRRELIQPLVA